MPRWGGARKLASLRLALAERGADWHFLATLDDIAWLFNLRGSDVSFNPVFVSFALVSQEVALLFVAESKVDAPLRRRCWLPTVSNCVTTTRLPPGSVQ